MAMTRTILTALTVMAVGTGVAWANAMTSNDGRSAQTMAPTMAGQDPHVGHQELVHFAQAIRAVAPIDQKAHKVLANPHLGTTQKHADLVRYDHQITTALHEHHLSPVTYEVLLHKAQVDPSFAKRTERMLKKG